MILLDYDQEKIDGETNKVVLFFGAPWCGNCRKIKPAILKVEKNTDIPIYYTDMEKGIIRYPGMNIHGNKFTNKYEISYLPTIIMLDNGVEIKRLVGYHTYSELKEFFDHD